MSVDRFKRGEILLEQVYPGAADEIGSKYSNISEDFATHLISIFGDHFSRKALDARTRELIIISSLVTLGYALPQLEFHINAALNLGSSKEEITEIILQLTAYAGFPAAVNAIAIAKKVFTERDLLVEEID